MRTHGGVAQGALRGAVPGRFICAKFARVLMGALCLFLTLLCHAQAAKYFYDANGRLVAMTRQDGTAARYVYDTMGNLTEVRAEPAGALRLFSFMPTHGAPGTSVTLYGQGFDGSALSVSFNGAAGAIQSSTANELRTTVPDGATTGPITVSAGGQSVASDTPFVVDDTGLAPQITGVAPTVVATGTTVTVSGNHLHPATGQSTVSIGSVALSPASATNAQIQFAVPPGVGSGKVTVSTTYGQATSAEDLVVVPASVGVANVVASTRVVVDGLAGPGVSIAAGKYGAILFDAALGSWISVQLDQFTTTTSNVNYSVYDPVGRLVVRGSMSPQVPTIHLPQTAITGTYTVLVQPDNAGMQFQARAESALRMSIDGNDLPFSTVSGGESRRILFTGQSGDNLEVALSGVSVTGGTPYNDWVRFTVYDPANRTIAGVGMGDRNSTRLWGVTGGTFQLIVSPGGGSGGLLKIQSAIATLTRDVIGPPLAYGTTTTLNLPRPGQTMRQFFTANAGDMVALVANAITTTPANNNVYFTIYRADGGQWISFNTTSSATWNLDSLPDSGTYMVVTTGAWGTPNTTQLTLLHGVTDTLTVDGPSKSYTTAARGQNIYLSFNANAGDNLELALSDVSVTGGVPYDD